MNSSDSRNFSSRKSTRASVTYTAGRDLFAAEGDMTFGGMPGGNVPAEVLEAISTLRAELDDMRLTHSEHLIATAALDEIEGGGASAPGSSVATAVKTLAGVLTGVGAVMKAGTVIGESFGKIVGWLGPIVGGIL